MKRRIDGFVKSPSATIHPVRYFSKEFFPLYLKGFIPESQDLDRYLTGQG
jgi:hypothetical protein